jgi:hypothetical protein
MDVPSLGAMVLANAPLEARMKFIRDICISLNIAHLHFDLNVTGTNADPFANEVITISDGVLNEDVTEHLSYDKILSFMSKGCESEEPLLRKDVIKAREIMIAIWRKATGGQQTMAIRANTVRIYREIGKSWIINKSRLISDYMDHGPKILKIRCINDHYLDDETMNISFWNIVFDDRSYEIFTNHWLV